MEDTLRVMVAGKEVVFRRPKHNEMDLALMGRLFNQFVDHKLEAENVKGGPGAALKIDDCTLKMEDCLRVIVDSFRRMLRQCATMFDGRPAEAGDFPDLEAENVAWWSELVQESFLVLMDVAAPGKSEGRPLSVA